MSKFAHIYTDSMNRISEYDFTVNQDFVCVSKNLEAEKSMTYDNWQGRIDYYITLDMANFHSPTLGSAILL